jgi:putative oxidoreductase
MSSSTFSAALVRPTKAWHVTLWIVQIILALMFGLAGAMKAATPMPVLLQKMAWVGSVPPGLVRFIGLCELVGAIGLVLPAATRIKPGLTALAATGLLAIMALAVPFHISRGETKLVAAPITLGLLAAFVAWGRLRKAVIVPRSQAR